MIKNFEEILPLIIAIIIAILLFLGFVTAIKKFLKPPAKQDKIDSTMSLKEQQWRMDDVRRRQKQLLRDRKQKMRDMQRR